MGQFGRSTLKAYFLTGAKPSQSNFSDLIDSSFNLVDDVSSGDSFTASTPEVADGAQASLSWTINDGDTVTLGYLVNGSYTTLSSAKGDIKLKETGYAVSISDNTVFTLSAWDDSGNSPVLRTQKQLQVYFIPSLDGYCARAFTAGYAAVYTVMQAGNLFALTVLNTANVTLLGTAMKLADYSKSTSIDAIISFYTTIGESWDPNTYTPILNGIFGGGPANAAPTHYWAFDEPIANSDPQDPIGNVTGRLLGGATHTYPGCIGAGAIAINGVDGCKVDFSNQVGQFGQADFSVALWFSTKEQYRLFDIIGNRTASSDGNFFGLRMTGAHESLPHGMPWAEVDESGSGTNYGQIQSSATGLNDGNWHHLAFTRSGVSLTLYVDGAQVGQTTTAATTNINNGNDFVLGRSLVGADSQFTPLANYDELYIYTTALTSDQVLALFKLRK